MQPYTEELPLPLSAYTSALASHLAVPVQQAVAVLGFTVLNTKTSAQYVLVFDADTLPGNGAIPVVTFTVSGSDNLGVAWTPYGRRFEAGIVLANSSTAATLTAGSADCWFDVQYVC